MRSTVVPLLVLCASLGWAKAGAADPNSKPDQRATLVSLQGTVLFDADGKGQWRQARLDDAICQNGRVRVEPYSRASLSLPNGVVLRLDEGTILSLHDITRDEPTALDLLKGFVHFISRTPKHLEITSPIANAGPEGTEFAMKVDDAKASLWVYEGAVRFFNPRGSIRLTPGQGAEAVGGQAPRSQIEVKPQDAVNWALYYPPILPYPKPSANIDNAVRTAIEDFRRGRGDQALLRLDRVAPEQQTPYFFKVRGAVRLMAGRVALAQEDIRNIFSGKPNDAEALALQSVLALTQNRKEEALQLANKAVASDPASPAAYSALSYAEQGRFDLDKALAAAEQATRYAPHDAMVWARKAEIELAQGATAESQQTAQRALALDAGLERTQTVTGFSFLLRSKTADARKAFQQALELDSTSPLARLGLGLAKIHDGNLPEGRHDLEIAAVLDPNNSLIRSYLGKAYYEEKRIPLAEVQFALAKVRDPKDPTPYFYDALNKQTANRPVEALQDIQKAIDLNGNRGVYRSNLSLDKDLAARSAAQGRIYNDLGFQRLGVVEGWKSVSNDPANYSAHRLLADNYASQPRSEIARVSELLQSQLLQPLNITPIQPQLGEKNFLTLQSLGPSSSSFYEFNPLFTRNNFALQASGFAGSNNTLADEIVHSGLWKNLSYSVGQFHYDTDGFRQNNDVQVDLFTGFIQANITPNLNLQAEIRHKTTERGDIDMYADGYFDPFFRLGSDKDTYRAGMHYSFNEHSELISSYLHLDGQSFTVVAGNNPVRQDFTIDGDQGEIQHLFKSKYLSAISGFGFAQSGFSRIDNPIIGNSTSHATGYIYTYTHYPHDVDWTLGMSVDSFERNSNDSSQPPATKNQVNPKIGMLWRASPGTIFRWAVARTLKRSLITDQTIEPTQVAGFNQLFDDYTGTDTWLYGAAIDHKFNANLYGGLEFRSRDLALPASNGKAKWNEHNYLAYMNWNLTERLAANISFNLERFHGDELTTGFAQLESTTYDSKAGLRYFDPSGFFCNTEAEYVNQRADWPGVYDIKHNEFVLFNAGIGMRLPKRLGIINLDIKNIFDRQFEFQSLAGRSPQTSAQDGGQPPPFIPGRTVFARLTLAF
ncbi:tetratricopeptide repeat protein [Methylomicrobium lacus]|uniref:tetratricopeptide repeat protein n=1 Tax=Methylomicrobium lacus TaxID=136992 RepID=UPI0035A8579C